MFRLDRKAICGNTYAVLFAINGLVFLLIGVLFSSLRLIVESWSMYWFLLVFVGFLVAVAVWYFSDKIVKPFIQGRVVNPETAQEGMEKDLVSRVQKIAQEKGLKNLPEIFIFKRNFFKIPIFCMGARKHKITLAVWEGFLKPKKKENSIRSKLKKSFSFIASKKIRGQIMKKTQDQIIKNEMSYDVNHMLNCVIPLSLYNILMLLFFFYTGPT